MYLKAKNAPHTAQYCLFQNKPDAKIYNYLN